MPSKVTELVFQAAQTHKLDPKLIAAIILQESRGDRCAWRYEDGFYRHYIQPATLYELGGHLPPSRLLNQAGELRARAYSWGLMQIMGQTARENGFSSDYWEDLWKPEINIPLGCRVFARKLRAAGNDTRKALLLWNGGGNPKYDDEVLARIENGEADKFLAWD